MHRLLLLCAAVVLAGCGSGSGPKNTDGKSLFAGSCGSCHRLADAGTAGTFGPDLDDLKPDQAKVAAAIKNGPGGMPAKLLEGARADAVARYVASTVSR